MPAYYWAVARAGLVRQLAGDAQRALLPPHPLGAPHRLPAVPEGGQAQPPGGLHPQRHAGVHPVPDGDGDGVPNALL